MGFFKKQSVGFYFGALTVILGIAGVAAYFGNCGTDYFKSLGTNTTVTSCLIAAVVCEVIFLLGNEVVGDKVVLDLFPVATAVLFMVGLVNFVSNRVDGLAAIMTFNNNASTMADLKNTIVAFAICGIALLLAIITSFMSVVKEK